MTRLRDDELHRLADSSQKRLASMAKELIEARDRGTMPTVDLASQLHVNRIPENMVDGNYVAVPDGCLHVCAYTPEKDGKGKTTAVMLQMEMPSLGASFVHRMKSGPAVDQLIRLLAQYRNDVWPSYRGVSVR